MAKSREKEGLPMQWGKKQSVWLLALFAALLPALLLMVSAKEQQGKRMALLIGNAEYSNTAKLNNPGNDVDLLASVFEKDLRFDIVVKRKNLSVKEMDQEIESFLESAKGEQVPLSAF